MICSNYLTTSGLTKGLKKWGHGPNASWTLTDTGHPASLFQCFNTLMVMNLFIMSILNNISRRMLWGMLSKALLKSRLMSTAFLSSPKWTLAQNVIKVVRQDFFFINSCWLCQIIALFFNWPSVATRAIISEASAGAEVRLTRQQFIGTSLMPLFAGGSNAG